MHRIVDMCPLCGADLSALLVSRRLAVVDPHEGNQWQCPDCLGTWPAGDAPSPLATTAETHRSKPKLAKR